jgi:radical SAM superfamily enzyme YgiQ (UPF0313 family)
MKSNMNRIMLVNAPSPQKLLPAGNAACFDPLNLRRIATFLKSAGFPFRPEIMIADGSIYSIEEIKGKIDSFRPGIVGISVLTSNYGEGLKIAEHAHGAGAATALGNDHASLMCKKSPLYRPQVDCVIRAEYGEGPFAYFVGLENGIPASILEREFGFEGQETAGAKAAEVIMRKEGAPGGLVSIRLPDRDSAQHLVDDFGAVALEDWKRYWSNYNRQYGAFHKGERRTAIINNARGCSNAKRPCNYCGIYDLGLKSRAPAHFWEAVEKHHEKHGIDFFFEVYDNFLSSPRYVRELLRAMDAANMDPVKMGIEFEIYARADSLLMHKDSVPWLKKMNVTRVNIGADSGDDLMLHSLGKNMGKRLGMEPTVVNWHAIRQLHDAGITLHVSFVLGELSETRQSLRNTVEFVRAVVGRFKRRIAMVEASPMMPLPGSRAWDMLMDALRKQGKEQRVYTDPARPDEVNGEFVVSEWQAGFTKAGKEDVEDAEEKIRRIIGAHGVAGNMF